MEERWWSLGCGKECPSLFWDGGGGGGGGGVGVDVESVAGLQDVSVGGKAVLVALSLLLFLVGLT